MKKLNNCVVENCIPTPSSCVIWNGGDIEFLGICNGEPINNLLWEILNKLEEIAGQNLSDYDIDSLLDICNQKAPQETTLISILDLLKNNQVCLKDYIDTLNDKLNELFQDQGVNVNLKCYADFDNQGNSLSITRDQLDQLVIDKLCNHKDRIETLEGKIITLQSQVDDLEAGQQTDEVAVATCIDAGVKPTSTQIVTTSQAHCDLEEATGTPADIASALSMVPSGWNTKYGSVTGWIMSPSNQAEVINNLLIVVGLQGEDITFMQENCCALTCDDVELGFTATFNEDMDGIIIKFTSGAGTNIPAGFEDLGSTGTITDIDGNVESFTLEIANNSEIEIPVTGLNLSQPLTVNITAKIGTEGLTCEKCLSKKVMSAICAYCEISAVGEDGSSAVIIYETDTIGVIIEAPAATTTTTTTTSTTTTTTAAP